MRTALETEVSVKMMSPSWCDSRASRYRVGVPRDEDTKSKWSDGVLTNRSIPS